MAIVSLRFFFFSAAVLFFYHWLPRERQNWLLLLVSYLFYIAISWQYAVVLLFMTLVNYALGAGITRAKRARTWLTLGVAINLAIWLFFKRSDFFVPQLLGLLPRLGISLQTQGLRILLPVGLSFYMLQAISYLVDTFRGQFKDAPALRDFALYLAFFPKLISGPIERPGPFLKQLAAARTLGNDLLARSFYLIVVGLVRKVVIADTLLQAVPARVFKMPLKYSALELAIWLLTYGFGIYNDFCGYSNIVRGISGLFGITLSRNFAVPLFSRNFSEFWNRWHRSLSLWLRDYIYFPVGRFLVRRNPSLTNPANLILPPLATMLASGLWHGPRWHFLAWGFLLSLYLVGENIVASYRPVLNLDRLPSWRQWLSRLRVCSLATAAFVPFVMDLPRAREFVLALASGSHWVFPNSRVFLVMIPSLWIDFVQDRRKDEFAFLSWSLPVRATLLALAALAVFLFSQDRISEPFIYQGF